MLLLEHVLVLRAHRHDVGHVDLVEGRQHRRGVLHVLQPPRDGLAQPRHLHALFARGIVGGRRRAHLHGSGRLIDRGRRGRRLLDRGQHVALGDAAILAGAGNGGGIDAAFGGEFSNRRRQRRIRRRGLRSRSRRGGGSGRGGGGLGGRGGAACAPPARAVVDLAEQRADGDGLAVLGRDLAEHAGGRRRDFDGDLVGLELDQRLVHRDGVAGLLEPAADGGFRHGLAERRNTNFSHGMFSSIAPWPGVIAGRSSAPRRSSYSKTSCPGHAARRRRFAPSRGHDDCKF